MSRFVFNTFQPKSVVKYRCRHGLGLLRIVRLASNNTDPAISTFNFQLSGYAFAERLYFNGVGRGRIRALLGHCMRIIGQSSSLPDHRPVHVLRITQRIFMLEPAPW
jgi:hypothetical protein